MNARRGEVEETRICTTAKGCAVSTGKGMLLHLVSVLPCVLHIKEDGRNAIPNHFGDIVGIIRVLIHYGIFLTDMHPSPDS